MAALALKKCEGKPNTFLKANRSRQMTASAPENLLTMELKKMADFGGFFGGVTRLHIAVQVQIMLFAIIFKAAFFKKQSKAFLSNLVAV